MKITKLQLYTDQLQDLKIFYVMVLGFDLYDETENAFTIKAGSSLLTFQWTDLTNKASPSYHFAFNIPKNQIEEAQRWLYSRSVPLLQNENEGIVDFPNWNAQALYFLDPANNIVELIARHDLENTSQAAFIAQSITSISEIGLPVPEIAPFYEQVRESFGFPVYSHIGNTTSFCPTGDPEGLLIIVPLERPWFPTEFINGIYPATVTMTGNEPKELCFQDLPYVLRME